MKKWGYGLFGFMVGVFLMMSGETIAAQVKSMIGQKVTGELNVVVNGEQLKDKGAVINGRTNAPVRAISDALGGELKLDKDTVYITTKIISTNDQEDLIAKKKKVESSIIELTEERNKMAQKYQEDPNPGYEGALSSYDRILSDKKVELNQINEALKAFE